MPYICHLFVSIGPTIDMIQQHNLHQPPELRIFAQVLALIVSIDNGKNMTYVMKKASNDRFRQLGFLNMVMNVAWSSFSAST